MIYFPHIENKTQPEIISFKSFRHHKIDVTQQINTGLCHGKYHPVQAALLISASLFKLNKYINGVLDIYRNQNLDNVFY